MEKIFTIFLLLITSTIFSQNLNNILEGYTVNKVPSDRLIVGAKWVKGFEATTEGLSEDKLIISKSLNQFSLDKESSESLGISVLSVLGLTGYSSNEITVIFNELQIYSIKNIYEIPLLEGEKIVFSAVKAGSFDLIFTNNLESAVKAKIPLKNLEIDAEVNLGDRKRITINGSNLFVAQKIAQVTKIITKTKSKKLKGSFEIQNILGYDFSFNVTKLVKSAEKRTIEEIGQTNYDNLKGLGQYIQKYSNEENITLSILSKNQGATIVGMFNKKLDFCYCKVFGDIDGRLFLINSTNSGNLIKIDYLLIEKFWINYQKGGGIGFLTSGDDSKISVISKEYQIKTVSD